MAKGLNPIQAKDSKKVLMLLAIHDGLAENKRCMHYSKPPSLSKNKEGENVVFRSPQHNRSVLKAYSQKKSTVTIFQL